MRKIGIKKDKVIISLFSLDSQFVLHQQILFYTVSHFNVKYIDGVNLNTHFKCIINFIKISSAPTFHVWFHVESFKINENQLS